MGANQLTNFKKQTALLPTLHAAVRLTRPLNGLITFISIYLAASISPQFTAGYKVFAASLSALFIAAGGNIINDIYDLEIDRINRPERPLAAGAVSLGSGKMLYTVVTLAGLALAWMLGSAFFLLAFSVAVLLLWYSAHLKRTVLFGNFAVSLISALTFIYGAMAVNDWQAGVIPAVFAFFFHFGREIIKDMQDRHGDLQSGVRTLPGTYGLRVSAALVNILFLVLIVLTVLPYIFYNYSVYYLWLVVPGVDAVLLYVSLMIWKQTDPHSLGRLSGLLKIDMFVGLIAIWLGTHHAVFFN